MTRRSFLSLVATATLLWSGCLASSGEGRAMLQEQLDVCNAIAEELASINATVKPETKQAKISELCAKLQTIQDKINTTKLYKGSAESLDKEFNPKFATAIQRIVAETGRVALLPGGEPIKQTIMNCLQKLGDSAKKK